MTADEYLYSIVEKYNVKGEVDFFTKLMVVDPLVKIIKEWAGGKKEAYKPFEPLLKEISAKVNGEACCT